MANNGNIRSSAAWMKYQPKKREGYLDKYKGRFVVILAVNRKTLYLSDMIAAKLLKPDYVSLMRHENLIGIAAGTHADGYKVKYLNGDTPCTPCINIEGFIKESPFEPGAYEAHVERIDAQTVDGFDLVVFDTADHPAKL